MKKSYNGKSVKGKGEVLTSNCELLLFMLFFLFTSEGKANAISSIICSSSSASPAVAAVEKNEAVEEKDAEEEEEDHHCWHHHVSRDPTPGSYEGGNSRCTDRGKIDF